LLVRHADVPRAAEEDDHGCKGNSMPMFLALIIIE
jgi:hypothetical protein